MPSAAPEAAASVQDSTKFTTPIAICGIGLRLPGGIRDCDSFWDLLVNGKDARMPIPTSRYNASGYDGSLRGKGAIDIRHGYFLDEDLSSFDATLFSMSRAELEKCDPQQRLLLEVVRESLEDAGVTDYRGHNIGCYVANFGHDWMEMNLKELQRTQEYNVLGYTDMMLANRVSYEYDLRGPSVVLKTACSSSFLAIHSACRDLQAGDASGAIVGGVSLILGPTLTSELHGMGVLSPEGSCKSFDANANGFARAEGIAAVFLKPLDSAVRDGNPIRAVIRGTGSNSDGRSPGIMNPRGEAHEALMRHVYRQSGLDPQDTAFVECHGTGTTTGDPIETEAVGNVFGKQQLYIGSVKPNVGHSEGCSGLTSLIKAVLALENKTIPPNIKFKTPNPSIPFKEKKLVVPVKPVPIPSDRAERISINSFGIGGSNAHQYLDQGPAAVTSGPQVPNVNGHTNGLVQSPEAAGQQLLVFSANSQESLRQQTETYRTYMQDKPRPVSDVGYTLAIHREVFPWRAFALCNNNQIAHVSNSFKAPTAPPAVVMIFNGQGAQWPTMGSQLISTNIYVRDDLVAMDAVLQSLRRPPSWSICEELLKPAETSRINDAELAQPLSIVLQIALYHELRRLGIEPIAAIGHSSGETAAAYAAGRISLKHALAAAYYRGSVTKGGDDLGGTLAAVGLGLNEISRFLRPDVCVACENSPNSTTISGDREAVTKVLESIKASVPGTFARLLREYIRFMEGEDGMWAPPTGADESLFFSSVTGNLLDGPVSPRYWARNLVSQVRFGPAVSSFFESAGRDMNVFFLEVGPHSTLAGPLREICAGESRPYNYASCQSRGQDSQASFLSAVGRMYQAAVPIDFKALYSQQTKAIAGLPAYPWNRSGPFWYESRLSNSWRQRKFPHHSLLGLRSPESPDFSPTWRNMLNLDDVPWISEHKIGNNILLPLTGYISMVGEAVRQITGVEAGYRLRHVDVSLALVLPESRPVEVVTVLNGRHDRLKHSGEPPLYDFTIASYGDGSWLVHCVGEASALEKTTTPDQPLHTAADSRLSRKLACSEFYEKLRREGLIFGPAFQLLSDVVSSVTERLAEAQVTNGGPGANDAPCVLGPTVMDAGIQLTVVAEARGLCRNLDHLRLPVAVGDIQIWSGSPVMRARAKVQDDSSDIMFVTDSGEPALHISGLRLADLEAEAAAMDVHAGARLHWLPDFDFTDSAKLLGRPCRSQIEVLLEERITLLCMLESADKLVGLSPCQPHFAKHREWLSMQIQEAKAGKNKLVKEAEKYVWMTSPQRQELIERTYSDILRQPGQHFLATGIKRIYENADQIFTGQNDTMSVLMQDGLLTDIYNSVSFDFGDFVRLLANNRPDLRILEIGAGTGGATELILRRVTAGDCAFPVYSKYTFTDVSAGFFPQAKERFSYAPNMEFITFDITRDGGEQGFEASSYDLILGSNVVHATPCLRETLSNLEKLLKPDGFLLLGEICSFTKSSNYVFGNLAGWWLGDDDGRVWGPYVQPERWDVELKAAGFTGVDSFVPDYDLPYRMTGAITSRPKRITNKNDGNRGPPRRHGVTLLCQDPGTQMVWQLKNHLTGFGWAVETCQLGSGQAPPKGQSIILCLGLEGQIFDQDMTESYFVSFMAFLQALDGQRVLWLARPIQLKCRDPRSAQALGVARTARTELSLPIFTLEIDPGEPSFNELVRTVFEKMERAEDGISLHADREFAVDNGTICIGRYLPFDLERELSGLAAADAKAAANYSAGDAFSLPAAWSKTLKPDFTYILVGGAGGVGRSIATWLAENGATDLTFLSRSAGTDEKSQSLFRELRDAGCNVHAVAGSVDNMPDVEKAISKSGKPVKGVFHLAMVLKDTLLSNMTYNDWVTVLRPKVDGAWNLHHALRDSELDFFWLASTLMSAIETPVRGNYVATGTFIEAFCQYRHSLGLPASVLNICAIEGVGMAANAGSRKHLEAQNIYYIEEREFLKFLWLSLKECSSTCSFAPPSNGISDSNDNNDAGSGLAMTATTPWTNRAQVFMGIRSRLALTDPNNRASWLHNRRMGVYHNVPSEDETRDARGAHAATAVKKQSSLESFLLSVNKSVGEGNREIFTSSESIDFVALELGKKIRELMLKPDEEVDVSLTLEETGLDSLVAVELRKWNKQVFGVTTSVLEIVGSGTLRGLSKAVLKKMVDKIHGEG